MEIKIENMTNPPEKIKLMYEAVSELIREQRDINSIKVLDITQKAGIGKGTAYEYFASKDEIILNALMYEYSNKIQHLARVAFEPLNFRDRVYKIMDWIKENREYNQMFSSLVGSLMGAPAQTAFQHKCKDGPFILAAKEYIFQLVDKFMEEGFMQGAFTEENPGKRCLSLITAMLQYSMVIMGPPSSRYGSQMDKDTEELREFVYESMIKALS